MPRETLVNSLSPGAYTTRTFLWRRGDHVDAFTCYIGTELRRIPDEETVGQLKLQILKLIFDAQATTVAYGNAHPQQ